VADPEDRAWEGAKGDAVDTSPDLGGHNVLNVVAR